MNKVLLLGAGKIGRMIAKFLSDAGYDILVADIDKKSLSILGEFVPKARLAIVDVTNFRKLVSTMKGYDAVVSALCYEFNVEVARAALKAGLSYFDLTEDNTTCAEIRSIATQVKKGQIFMPQCGLAPGFVSIAAHHLSKTFDSLATVHMRVGALPQYPTNFMKYNLTWSTDGLINEYCNLCESIHDGKRIDVLPLQGLEHFSLDGVRYEAFNTSGGLGTLCETLDGQVQSLNYKTIRYMGHRKHVSFLIDDLKLGKRRGLLKEILENSIPITMQDVVIVFCTVTGMRNGHFVQLSDARKIYNREIDGETWSAIQITTASGICAAIDLHFDGKLPPQGFVKQEQVLFNDFINNKFGQNYQEFSSN